MGQDKKIILETYEWLSCGKIGQGPQAKPRIKPLLCPILLDKISSMTTWQGI